MKAEEDAKIKAMAKAQSDAIAKAQADLEGASVARAKFEALDAEEAEDYVE